MLHYIARRVLIGFLTLGLITLVVYGLIRNMPGDPLALMVDSTDFGGPDRPVSAVFYEEMKKEMGLDDLAFFCEYHVSQGMRGAFFFGESPAAAPAGSGTGYGSGYGG